MYGTTRVSGVEETAQFHLRQARWRSPCQPSLHRGRAQVAVVGWSVKTKVDTGSGLPAGPFGLLGAVEGFAFLLAAAGVGVAAYSAVANGCAPFCCRPLPCNL